MTDPNKKPSAEDVARKRDETIRRMFATPPKKRPPKGPPQKPGKRGS